MPDAGKLSFQEVVPPFLLTYEESYVWHAIYEVMEIYETIRILSCVRLAQTKHN